MFLPNNELGSGQNRTLCIRVSQILDFLLALGTPHVQTGICTINQDMTSEWKSDLTVHIYIACTA